MMSCDYIPRGDVCQAKQSIPSKNGLSFTKSLHFVLFYYMLYKTVSPAISHIKWSHIQCFR